MSIYTVNSKNTITRKIELLNDMIKEVNGLVQQGKFDINEIVQIIIDTGIDRKYIRNVNLGNTLSDYTDWTHVQAEDGYSIWKLTPTSYTYNILNKMYQDNKVLTNQGQGNSETATTFDFVYLYNGDSGAGFTDNTTEAGTESGTEFESMDSSSDYLYLGEAATFTGAKFEWQTRGSNYTLIVEYWNGSAWTTMTANTNTLSDGTSNFQSNGLVSWVAPDDWATTAVNSQTKYWVRFSTSSTPVTTAKIYLVIPGNSVVGLLALSSTEIQQETWKWCSYSGNVYVTVRNTGATAYEGNAYLASSSSTTNKQNFFIYNHTYSLDHQDSTYDSVVTKTSNYIATGNESIILLDASGGPVDIQLPSASGNEGKRIILKAIDISSGATVTAESGGTIDGASYKTFASQYDVMTVLSNGTVWYIISN